MLHFERIYVLLSYLEIRYFQNFHIFIFINIFQVTIVICIKKGGKLSLENGKVRERERERERESKSEPIR